MDPTYYALLLMALPIVGKVLLTIPFIANKAIPFILVAFNFAMKYWVLLGFPKEVTAEPTVLTGSIFGSWFGVTVWTMVENYMAHRFYEGKKAEARLAGKTSWWERGKRDVFQGKP